MAKVTLPDGRSFEISDSDSQLEAYYLGEGATVEKSATVEAAGFPRVYQGGDEYAPVEVEQLPDGEFADPTGPVVASVGQHAAADVDEHADDESAVDGGPGDVPPSLPGPLLTKPGEQSGS